jgi:hypothetical protein
MRRIADAHIAIAILQHVDLIELQGGARRRILRDAGHQREILVAMAQEGHDIVHVGAFDASRRADDRQIDRGDLFQQRPVREGAAGDFENVEAILDDPVDRSLVERRAHREKAFRLDGGHEAARRVAVQPRLGEALDVFYVGPILEGRMDEGVELAKLQFEGEVEIELPRQRAELGDNAQAMVDVAHVIIGEFEDEQRLGNGLGRRGGRLVKHDRCPVSSRAAAENRNALGVLRRDQLG